jgi:integrase/recombinase XerD
MPRGLNLTVRFADWPAEDQRRWEAAFKTRDRFDEAVSGAQLSASTRKQRRESYGRFLRFLTDVYPDRLAMPPEGRINRDIVAEYASWRKTCCSDISVSVDLFHLGGVLKLMAPNADWSWLLTIAKRGAANVPRTPGKYHLATSDRLYKLGIELMDGAVADAAAAGCIRPSDATRYRDGLIIAFLALIPLRARTLVALRIGCHLTRVGIYWNLDIPAADTKNRRPLDYVIKELLAGHIDRYLERFRAHIPGADKHDGLWACKEGCPMSSHAISMRVRRRTKKAFGFSINLHRFRHAAASFWSVHDPVNVRGAKDLLGHATFAPTEKHYIMSQSRQAARALAQAIRRVGKSHL